jgi:hypothetical protein
MFHFFLLYSCLGDTNAIIDRIEGFRYCWVAEKIKTLKVKGKNGKWNAERENLINKCVFSVL